MSQDVHLHTTLTLYLAGEEEEPVGEHCLMTSMSGEEGEDGGCLKHGRVRVNIEREKLQVNA